MTHSSTLSGRVGQAPEEMAMKHSRLTRSEETA